MDRQDNCRSSPFRAEAPGGASNPGHVPVHARAKFRLFFGGQLISQVANWLTLVAQTLPYCTTASGVLTARAVIVGVWMMNPHELRAAPITPRSTGPVRAGLRYARSDRRAQLERARFGLLDRVQYLTTLLA